MGGCGSWRRLLLPLEQPDNLLDREPFGLRQEPVHKGDGQSTQPGEDNYDPARLIAFWVTGKTSISAKFASQSIIAANAAAYRHAIVQLGQNAATGLAFSHSKLHRSPCRPPSKQSYLSLPIQRHNEHHHAHLFAATDLPSPGTQARPSR